MDTGPASVKPCHSDRVIEQIQLCKLMFHYLHLLLEIDQLMEELLMADEEFDV